VSGSSCCDASLPGAWEGGEVPRFFVYVESWVTGAQSVALSHGFLAMIKWTVNRLQERFIFPRHGMRPTRLPRGMSGAVRLMGDVLNATGVGRPP
jgi:hypothetical protein